MTCPICEAVGKPPVRLVATEEGTNRKFVLNVTLSRRILDVLKIELDRTDDLR